MKKRLLILFITAFMLSSLSVNAASAVVESTDTKDENSESNVYVDVVKASNFTVILPKVIRINPEEGVGEYVIKVKGDMNPNQVVTVECNETIELVDSIGNATTVPFDVSNNKTVWTWQDIDGGVESVSNESVQIKDGEIIPAGTFAGLLTFNIACEVDLCEGLLTASDLEFLGYDLATATDITIPASIDYGNGQVKTINSIQSGLFQNNTVIEKVSIEEGIIEVAPYTFAGCTNLTTVVMPDSMNKIREGAFKDTTSLTSFNVTKNVRSIDLYAFNNSGISTLTFDDSDDAIPVDLLSESFKECTNLSTLTFPTTRYVDLSADCFRECTSLKEVTCGSNVELNSAIFKGCTALESADIDLINTDHTSSMFAACTNLQSVKLSNAKDIGNYMFVGCNNLSDFTVNDGLESIGIQAFDSCWSLKTLPIQPTLTEIDSYAFFSCFAATGDYVWPAGCTKISDNVFKDCENISSITINSVVTEVGDEAFYNCGITSLSFPDGLETIGDSAFKYSSSYTKNKLSSLTLPDTVTSIGAEAIKRTNITEFKVPANVTVLSDRLFEECMHLENIIIHDNITAFGVRTFDTTAISDIYIPPLVTVIPQECYKDCKELTIITIPDHVTAIQSGAFIECDNLTSASVPSTATIAYDAFDTYCGVTTR